MQPFTVFDAIKSVALTCVIGAAISWYVLNYQMPLLTRLLAWLIAFFGA